LKIVIFETKSHVTLTLTLDDPECDIVINVSSTLTNATICGRIVFACGRTDVRMDGHFYGVY